MREFALMSPSGEIVTGKNVTIFCNEHNLDRNYVYRLLSGTHQSYKGWTLPGNNNNQRTKIFEFTLMSPDGEIVTGKSVLDFCKENNLTPANIYKVIKGVNKSHKGWKLPETKKTGVEAYSKDFTLKSPNGEIVTGKNIYKFAEENNLNNVGFYSLISGKLKSYKGWTLPETNLFGRESQIFSKSKEFTLKSPDGEIFTGRNIKEFAKTNNLHSGALCNVLNGKAKSHKGWTLP